jgi:hypothetical protein
MFELIQIENVFYDLLLAIISAIIVVPIVFFMTDYLIFNQYLRLLTKEIKQDLECIDQLPIWLARVRNRERPWLPGINSNQPQPGYVLKYLSMNAYNNFLTQKYWFFLDRGTADKLSELYEFVRRYCDIIQELQTSDNGRSILRDSNQHVVNADYYNEARFCTIRLMLTTSAIKHHASALNLDNINSFKDPHWWYPNFLKNRLSD